MSLEKISKSCKPKVTKNCNNSHGGDYEITFLRNERTFEKRKNELNLIKYLKISQNNKFYFKNAVLKH